MGDEWKLRVRGPKGGGAPAELTLALGGKTTIAELRVLAGKATKVAAKRVILKCGFPPKELVPADDDASKTVWDAGLFNRDVLMIERAAGDGSQEEAADAGGDAGEGAAAAGGAGAAGSQGGEEAGAGGVGVDAAAGAGAGAAGTDPAAAVRMVGKGGVMKEKKERKRRIRMPGQGQRLGGGEDDEQAAEGAGTGGGAGAGTDAGGASGSGSGGAAPKRRKAGKERDIMATADALSLGNVETMEQGARLMLAGDLMAAAAGPSTWTGEQRSLMTSLRKSLKEARKARETEAQGEKRYLAASMGQVEFTPLTDGSGRLQVVYKGDPQARKPTNECVQDIPVPLLAVVLATVAADPDPVSRANLQPVSMAQVSQRMFWAVVHHGKVGPQKDFKAALQELCPPVDWSFIQITRERIKPERYADYVSH